METQMLEWFDTSGSFAVWLSIIINIIISVLGVVPSVFLTAANITFFGFTQGLVISILGEASGAVISFYLYRKGINKVKPEIKHTFLKKLQHTKGTEAFLLVIALRIFPFIPSGLVTFVSAGSLMGIINFSIASTVGKIPALFIEAYSVKQVLDWSIQGKIIMAAASIFIIGFLLKRK
ncbi:TVP38/TMEM64 family protein [Bacillus sp. FJAT-29814]|uniref:TVP38/TMEM64 family protein n=1 Tax=Bacillus sp. FJAT-29814 TaxID=1729688 RepID=UPI0008313EE2|nr:VTT domain-containing protein [Bacillus sp. FJAT-29814]